MSSYRVSVWANAPYPVEHEDKVQASSYPAAARKAVNGFVDALRQRNALRKVDGQIVIKIRRLGTSR